MNKNINNNKPELLAINANRPWLAPLAGYSDLPFRLLCREYGAAVAVTEMVSAKGLFYNSKASMVLLASYPDCRQDYLAASAPSSVSNTQSDKLGEVQQNLELQKKPSAHAWVFPFESILPNKFSNQPPKVLTAAELAESDFSAADPKINLSTNELQKINDAPLVVQLFGAEPEYLGQAVALLRTQGYNYFDCNMGCSVPKVVKSGAGAALMKDPKNALLVAKAMIEAAKPGTVGFKMRLGWERGSEVYLDLALELEALGAGWLTLHPRTATQAFTGKADWAALAKLKKLLKIPLIASGDLLDADAAVSCVEQTGVDSVMFARGAMQNPAVFKKYLLKLKQKGLSPSNAVDNPVDNNIDSPVDKWSGNGLGNALNNGLGNGLDNGLGEISSNNLELESANSKPICNEFELTKKIVLRHATLARNFTPSLDSAQASRAALLKMRTFVPRYLRNFNGVKELRAKLTKIESWQELINLLDSLEFNDIDLGTQ